jgi:hypothetical protein
MRLRCLQSLLRGCNVQDVDSPPSSSAQYNEDVSRASNALFGAVLQGPKLLAPPADPQTPTGTGNHLRVFWGPVCMLVAIANKQCLKPMQHMHAVLGPALQLSLSFPTAGYTARAWQDKVCS